MKTTIYHPQDFPKLPGSEEKVIHYNDGSVETVDPFGVVEEGDVVVLNLPLLITDAYCPCPKLDIIK